MLKLASRSSCKFIA